MLNLTAEAKQAWLAQTRQVNARVTIGTAVYNADKIMSIEYDSGSISGETFQIGSFYQNSIKVVLVGILESLANDNKVKLEFAVKVGQAYEWVNMGTFYVTELDRDRNSNRTTFTAVDASVYLGKNYEPTISFPNSLKNLVTDIANQCGVQVNFASMAHLADVNVTQPPSKYTCRQVISMVAQIHGGFARINRNDQLEVTRLMSSDIELSPSHYLLKGLTKNETTYRTDGIIVKIGENEEDVLKVGTTTGSAVINLENPLMTQTLLDEMWRVVSIISYYPFNLKWRGIPNLEAGDWITIVDKQGTRYRVPNLSYKLSFKGGLSAESSANTTATSNVQHKLRGTLTQRVADVEGYVNATGGRSYTGLDVPDNKYLKKGDTWYKPDGDDTAILVYDGEKWEEVASPEVFRQLQADFEALDKQAKEAFEQVDTLVQESPETKRLAQEAQEAVNLANKEITKLQTSVSDTKTALQNAEQEFADSLATTTRELTAKISGIDIGGRNLIKNTSKEFKHVEGSRWYWIANEINTKNFNLADYLGRTLTIRVYIANPKNRTKIQLYWNAAGWGGSDYLEVGQSGYLSLTINVPQTLPSVWNLVIGANEGNYNFDYKELKAEVGNIHTDWSPAPEDFQSDLSNTSIELSTKITESAAKLRTEMSEKYSTKNDLTTLQGEYSSFKEETAKKFSQQVSSISTIQTDTTEAQRLANDAYSKANSAVTNATNASSTANSAMTKASDATSVANSANQNATSAVASANSAVSTANTAKSNADKAIADVASLTKTVSSQSTRIDQTSSRIDQVASGVTEIGGRLDNLKLSDDNLLEKTDTSVFGIGNWSANVKGNISLDNSVKYQGRPTLKIDFTQNNNGAVNYQYVILKPNTEYYYSAVIKSNNAFGVGDSIPLHIWLHNTTAAGNHMEISNDYEPKTVNSNEWVTITRKFRTPRDYDVYYLYVLLYGLSGVVINVADIQVREGSKYIPWSPSSKDGQSQINGINSNIANNYYAKTTVDSKLSTAVSGITAQYTQDITTRLGNYYDKSTIDSKLTIDGQGIASYVKSTQSKLDNLQVGGTNLIRDTSKPFIMGYGIPNTKWENGRTILRYGKGNDPSGNSSEILPQNGVFNDFVMKRGVVYTQSMIVETDANANLNGEFNFTWFNPSIGHAYKRANVKKIGNERYLIWCTASVDVDNYKLRAFDTTNLKQVFYYYNSGSYIAFSKPKLEEGNTPTAWSPAPEDMATLTQYTEVKQLADRISSTVYDSASGLVTKTNQLAGKYAITNLNSYGDVLSSLNLNGGNVRIKGSLIDLDGNVRIQDGFVNNLKANSILANEITAQATTVVNARIANLDAGVITTGILKGTNLSLNLGTGEVQFQKGRIQAPNNTLDIQVNTGIMKVLNTSGEGVTFQNGNLYFSNANVQGYYGSIKYNQDFGGPLKGVKIDGYGGVMLASRSQKDTLFDGNVTDIKNGASLVVEEYTTGEGYIYLLSQNGIRLSVNKKIQGILGVSYYTGINIDKNFGVLTLAANNIDIIGDSIDLESKNITIYGGRLEVYQKVNTLFTGPVTFDGTTVFSNGFNFYGLVNGKRLVYSESTGITLDVKDSFTTSVHLEVTYLGITYKIPLQA